MKYSINSNLYLKFLTRSTAELKCIKLLKFLKLVFSFNPDSDPENCKSINCCEVCKFGDDVLCNAKAKDNRLLVRWQVLYITETKGKTVEDKINEILRLHVMVTIDATDIIRAAIDDSTKTRQVQRQIMIQNKPDFYKQLGQFGVGINQENKKFKTRRVKTRRVKTRRVKTRRVKTKRKRIGLKRTKRRRRQSI